MQSILITGADVQIRKEKAKAYAVDLSPYDITELDGNVIGIKDIRALISFLHFKSVSDKKVAIIFEAQNLSTEAQNALLKTLEEPPLDTQLLLTSPNSDSLLPTIVSRCQVIELTTDNKQLTTDELSTFNSQLSTLLHAGVGERLKLAQDVSKTKEEASLWLEKMIFHVREKMLHTPAPLYHNILVNLQKAHTALQTTNVNPRLTLENLLFSLETEGK